MQNAGTDISNPSSAIQKPIPKTGLYQISGLGIEVKNNFILNITPPHKKTTPNVTVKKVAH